TACTLFFSLHPPTTTQLYTLSLHDALPIFGEDGVEEDPLQGFEQVAPDQLDPAGKAEASQILRRELQRPGVDVGRRHAGARLAFGHARGDGARSGADVRHVKARLARKAAAQLRVESAVRQGG